MREVTEQERSIGRYVRSQFGSHTNVFRHADDDEEFDVFVVSGADCPVSGVTSYGTAGLSQYPMTFDDSLVAVEILGACSTKVKEFENVIASCAIERIKNKTPLVYGSAVENVIAQYQISNTMKHVVFTSPFLWEGFNARTFGDVEVHWLLAVPISDSELSYLTDNGSEALENIFEREQIDIYDINRSPAT